jgi:hypothetical protein
VPGLRERDDDIFVSKITARASGGSISSSAYNRTNRTTRLARLQESEAKEEEPVHHLLALRPEDNACKERVLLSV